MANVGLWRLIDLAFDVYFLVLLVRVIGSWMPPRASQTTWMTVYGWCHALTEPLMRPIRRVLERLTGRVGLDLSPLVLWLLLEVVRRAVLQRMIAW